MGSNRRGWAKWDHRQGFTLIHNQQLQHSRLSALNTVLVITEFVFLSYPFSRKNYTGGVLMYACMYTLCMYVCMCVCVCMYVCMYARTLRVRTCMHAYVHSYIHTLIHTYTHTRTDALHGVKSF
jgi:hypothetical protein